jgi:hypothetical protein
MNTLKELQNVAQQVHNNNFSQFTTAMQMVYWEGDIWDAFDKLENADPNVRQLSDIFGDEFSKAFYDLKNKYIKNEKILQNTNETDVSKLKLATVIIYGLTSCPDCDETVGWVEDEEAAKEYCKKKNTEIGNKSNYNYFYATVPHLQHLK